MKKNDKNHEANDDINKNVHDTAVDKRDQAIECLGEAIIEELQEKDQDDLEVFDLYTHALKSKIHIREADFCSRLVKGYDVLVENLRK